MRIETNITPLVSVSPELSVYDDNNRSTPRISLNPVILKSIARLYIDAKFKDLPSHLSRTTINELLNSTESANIEMAYAILDQVDTTATNLLRYLRTQNIDKLLGVLSFAEHFGI